MDNDDMHRFIEAIMRYGVVFALIATVLLIGIAALLIWKPAFLLQILRYGIAAICLGMAFWIMITFLIAVFKRGK